jgi:hypothetical protein
MRAGTASLYHRVPAACSGPYSCHDAAWEPGFVELFLRSRWCPLLLAFDARAESGDGVGAGPASA